jgi:hypothetical protein
VDPGNIGSVELTVIYDMLANKYGKDKGSSKGRSVVDRVIARILEVIHINMYICTYNYFHH